METKPIIPETMLRRVTRPYAGVITPGDVFAWEPDFPHARELCVVVKITETAVWTRPIESFSPVYGNDISRFREAVVPTIFKSQPTIEPGITVV